MGGAARRIIMIDQLWPVALGFGAGVLGSMVGLGGGIVVVPVLTFLGVPPPAAAGSSLFATLSNAAASTASYSRRGLVEYGLGLRLGLLSVPGTVLGALASAGVEPGAFQALFGAALAASAAYILLRRRLVPGASARPASVAVLAASASFFAGVVSSFFGVGGGVVFVPLMVAVMGVAMRRASATSQMALLSASCAGVISHSLLGHPDFALAGLLAAGSFAGGLAGARLSALVGEGRLRVLASAVILAVAARMFAEAAGLDLG